MKMKILFSLSKKHFNGETGTMNIPHSTGVMCKLFFDSIKDLGELTIIDSEDTSVVNQEFDLLVGLPRNFKFLTDHNKIKVATVFPNISEGKALKERLLKEAGRLGCKMRDAYAPSGYYHADHFFIIGNHSTFMEFEQAGIPASKITRLCYRMNLFPFKEREKNKPTVFLHSATTLGLRKGFWWVVDDFNKADVDAELLLMGGVQQERFWQEYLKEAIKNPRIKYVGWHENSGDDYREIIYKSDFIVFPSFGEGQPGTVTEAMEGGCLPLVSPDAGINEHPLGWYERGDASIFRKAVNMSSEDFREAQSSLKKTLESKYDNEVFIKTVRDKIKELCL